MTGNVEQFSFNCLWCTFWLNQPFYIIDSWFFIFINVVQMLYAYCITFKLYALYNINLSFMHVISSYIIRGIKNMIKNIRIDEIFDQLLKIVKTIKKVQVFKVSKVVENSYKMFSCFWILNLYRYTFLTPTQ